MFYESAALYDSIYTKMKNYEDEAAQVRAWINKLRPSARTILDVACGTGEHSKYLKAYFQIDGMDLNPEFLKIAQSKNSGGHYQIADMVDFDMGKKYDVLICLFSSIGYVGTQERLKKTVQCFAKHLNADGVMIVEPWLTPESWVQGKLHMMTVSDDKLKVCRMNIAETKDGGFSFFRFHYLVGTPTGVSHFTEDHTLGLFTVSEMKQAFSEAGLAVQYDERGIFGRGLYIAEQPYLARSNS
jgi:SAM-dependent methyltransferase